MVGAQKDVVGVLEGAAGGGDDGEGGLLAAGEAGIFRSPLISSHFLPFGGRFESPFDRAQDRLSTNGGEVFRLRGGPFGGVGGRGNGLVALFGHNMARATSEPRPKQGRVVAIVGLGPLLRGWS